MIKVAKKLNSDKYFNTEGVVILLFSFLDLQPRVGPITSILRVEVRLSSHALCNKLLFLFLNTMIYNSPVYSRKQIYILCISNNVPLNPLDHITCVQIVEQLTSARGKVLPSSLLNLLTQSLGLSGKMDFLHPSAPPL
jgi:hypothetical protein